MRRELDAAEAAWLEVVAAYDRSGDWRADGYLNAASAIRNACRMAQGVARRNLELARKLALPVVAEAFGRGEISGQHATEVANAYAPGRESEISGVEAELVEFARIATPHELGVATRRVTDAIDGDGAPHGTRPSTNGAAVTSPTP